MNYKDTPLGPEFAKRARLLAIVGEGAHILYFFFEYGETCVSDGAKSLVMNITYYVAPHPNREKCRSLCFGAHGHRYPLQAFSGFVRRQSRKSHLVVGCVNHYWFC